MFSFENLDPKTRAFMLEEAQLDGNQASEFYGRRLTDTGKGEYPRLLREAIDQGDESTLAAALRRPGLLKERETYTRDGVTREKKVPWNAADVLAEGEFNRFYIRGVCRRVIDEGRREVEVYRAKQVDQPRPESQALIGKRLDPAVLLEDLRKNVGVDTALGVPSGPNSGLSVRIPRG